ncbi:MAG: ferric reductase-like transmembrane domain-containing protein [Solirubrobacteraceae bacterium]
MTVGPSLYWFVTRASGAVALVLLTAAVVIGIAAIGRLRAPGVPRFMVDGIHRTTSLLAVVFVVVHVVTSVLDSFVSISLVAAVIPFGSGYRPLWLGLGAVSFDLLLAVSATSLLRARLGRDIWRAVHWLAYAAWPVAILHGFGTGSDARHTWMLAIDVACIAATLAAIVARAMIGWPDHLRARIGALGVAAAFSIGLAVWLPAGPLGKGWARRSGTPATLLSQARGGRA